jgi:uncharacterized protein
LTPPEALFVALAGVAAGMMNAVAGSGTLVTFPTLLAVGFPPVIANVSNNIGLVPGAAAGAFGYRRELSGQRSRLLRLSVASISGALIGAILLLRLPASTFRAVVPVLIAVACLLVVAQPWVSRIVASRADAPAHGGPLVWLLVLATGVYGGYFGAAQGIMLIAILGLGLDEPLQRVNAVKNVLAGLVNLAAALFFILVADVAWDVVALIAAGSICGGYIGGRYGRRLPVPVLRGVIVVIGIVAVVRLLRT